MLNLLFWAIVFTSIIAFVPLVTVVVVMGLVFGFILIEVIVGGIVNITDSIIIK